LQALPGSLIAPMISNTAYPILNFGIEDPSKVILILNFADALNYLHLILIFLLIELVDVTGTLKALVTPMKLDNEERVIEKVMHVEGVSTSVGALLGQPTVGTYIESAGAVSVGAKSGNASIVTAIAFLPVLFLTPFSVNSLCNCYSGQQLPLLRQFQASSLLEC